MESPKPQVIPPAASFFVGRKHSHPASASCDSDSLPAASPQPPKNRIEPVVPWPIPIPILINPLLDL